MPGDGGAGGGASGGRAVGAALKDPGGKRHDWRLLERRPRAGVQRRLACGAGLPLRVPEPPALGEADCECVSRELPGESRAAELCTHRSYMWPLAGWAGERGGSSCSCDTRGAEGTDSRALPGPGAVRTATALEKGGEHASCHLSDEGLVARMRKNSVTQS